MSVSRRGSGHARCPSLACKRGAILLAATVLRRRSTTATAASTRCGRAPGRLPRPSAPGGAITPSLYSQLPVSMLTLPLSGGAFRVYASIDLRAGKRGWWWGRQDEIAETTGLSTRAVGAAVATLRSAGLIATERRGRRDGVMLYRVMHRLGAEQPGLSVRMDRAEPVRIDRAKPTTPVRRDRAEPSRARVRSGSDLDHRSHKTTEDSPADADPYGRVVRREWPA
jgi:DNA-binding transcriptional ArsR family regulator